MRRIDLSNFQVATSETARDINRRIVLNLIRTHQPISRADLARHSGLQRSTVSVIAEQLIRDRWITEGANGHTPRGRRPQFLHLNKERVGIIGINVRPITTTLALADLDANFLAQDSLATPSDPKQFVAELLPRVRKLMRARPELTCEGIGVSLPGRVDLASKQLVFAPNLGWKDFDLKTPLEKATRLPVELENAANSCALSEICFGRRAEGLRNLIVVTVSEGIGCGLILNHQLVQGSTGTAGEFGHATLVQDGLECSCGNRGCWEMYASNSAATRHYTKSIAPARPTKRATETEKTISFEHLLRLADQGDTKAVEALRQMAKYLGRGMAPLVTGLAPDMIVIVGEVTRAWHEVGPIIKETIKQQSFTRAETQIVPSDPITQPRLRGTIALVLLKHFGAPA
ncbi:MAG TPA: ROK family transcriptional regulator, partial [Pyrinomonadaceae bacterium]|nr:ROK family transcriptional regulator [Pyrinomonadaceae bacterium]